MLSAPAIDADAPWIELDVLVVVVIYFAAGTEVAIGFYWLEGAEIGPGLAKG